MPSFSLSKCFFRVLLVVWRFILTGIKPHITFQSSRKQLLLRWVIIFHFLVYMKNKARSCFLVFKIFPSYIVFCLGLDYLIGVAESVKDFRKMQGFSETTKDFEQLCQLDKSKLQQKWKNRVRYLITSNFLWRYFNIVFISFCIFSLSQFIQKRGERRKNQACDFWNSLHITDIEPRSSKTNTSVRKTDTDLAFEKWFKVVDNVWNSSKRTKETSDPSCLKLFNLGGKVTDYMFNRYIYDVISDYLI